MADVDLSLAVRMIAVARATLKPGIRNPESGMWNLENKMGKTKESNFFKSEI